MTPVELFLINHLRSQAHHQLATNTLAAHRRVMQRMVDEMFARRRAEGYICDVLEVANEAQLFAHAYRAEHRLELEYLEAEEDRRKFARKFNQAIYSQ